VHATAQWVVDYEHDDYSFPPGKVTLTRHHKMTHGNITVNLLECMEYLTDEIDRADIISNTFVKNNWDCISHLALSEAPVDLNGDDVPEELKPLSKAIWMQTPSIQYTSSVVKITYSFLGCSRSLD